MTIGIKIDQKVNRTIHNKIDKKLEILICNIKNKLTQTKYAQIGV